MKPWLDDGDVQFYHGGAAWVLSGLAAESVQTCVTSPPYWGLRDYGSDAQLGLEPTPEAYVAAIVGVMGEVRRVLRDDGTLWLNLGDSFAGHNLPGWRGGNEAKNGGVSNKNGVGYVPGLKPKDLVGIPWRVAFALQADGWYLRSDIIWSKPNQMPESVTDRPTKAHEYLFLLSKRERYFYDADAIREPADYREPAPQVNTDQSVRATGPMSRNGHSQWDRGVHSFGTSAAGRNCRSVWEIATQPTPEAHFATYPEALVRRCILAGSRPGDTVLDPFIGSGTTALVARKHGRRCIGVDLSEEYLRIAERRTHQLSLLA